MNTILLVGSGGFIGSVLRYSLTQFIQSRYLSAFPFGTLSVNVLGCFIIGLIVAMTEKGDLNMDWRFFLATGICGGFTTFSAFSSETIGLIRQGQTGYAVLYVTASIVVGLIATFGGYAIMKSV